MIPPNFQVGTLAALTSDLKQSPQSPHPTLEFFTSGTTGEAKRVVKHASQLEAECLALETVWGNLLGDALIVATVPHHHIYGFRLVDTRPFESNLLTLLPPTEHNPLAEKAIDLLSNRLGNRAVFLIGHADPDQAHQSARQFAQDLRDAKAFERVNDAAPDLNPKALTDFYATYRFGLLAPSDRHALEAENFNPQRRLTLRQHQPFSSTNGVDLENDPFGFFQNWLASLPLGQTRLLPEDGQLVVRDASTTWVLVTAELSGSAYDAALQKRVVAATNHAQAALGSSGSKVLRTGGVFYGAAASASAEHEVNLIGAGSVIGIVLMMWWLFRSLRPLLLALLTVAFGLSYAVAATLLIFGHLHLITLVFGASLIGEAVDYAIQYFSAQLDAGAEWEPEQGLKRIIRALTIALATSLIGYAALALTPLPAISQIALFALVGLAAAWISVVLLPAFTHAPLPTHASNATRAPRALLDFWQRHVTKRRAIVGICVLVLLATPGWLQLHGNDDIKLLIARPADLQSEEASIRTLTGFANDNRFFLIEAADWETLLRIEEQLAPRLQAATHSAPLGLSRFVPSAARQAADQALLQKQTNPPERMLKAFSAAEWRDDIAIHWIGSAQANVPPLTVSIWLRESFSLPFRHLAIDTEGNPASVVFPQGETVGVDISKLAEGLPGVTYVDKAASVTALFSAIRWGASAWLPLACLIVGLVLVWRYGLRRGITTLLPTLLGMGVALAIYGYAEVPLTLFSLMGLILVLGVGANYSIFLVESGDRAPASFAGVLLSAATTLLAFGLLSLSSMPALKQFGLMLLIGISASVMLSPLALTFSKDPCATR